MNIQKKLRCVRKMVLCALSFGAMLLPAANPEFNGYRIVPIDPLLDRVDANSGKMTFYWNGEPAAAGAKLEASVDGGAAVSAVLGDDRRVTVNFGKIPVGEHRINLSLKAADGSKIMENGYVITAIPPPRPVAGRRLNNFVTEILNVPLADGDVEFDNPREGWVYIGFDKTCPSAEAFLDGSKEPVVTFRPDEPQYTMRWLEEGKHKVSVKGAPAGKDMRLAIRLVKPLSISSKTVAHETTDITKRHLNGYGWEFYRRFLLSAFNSYSMGEEWRLNSATGRIAWANAELMKRGSLPMVASGAHYSDVELRTNYARMRRKLPMMPAYLDGLAVDWDENAVNGTVEETAVFAECAWEMVADRSKKAMFIDLCFCPYQKLTKINENVSAYAAGLNTGRGHGMLRPEMYLRPRRTWKEWAIQEKKTVDFIESLRSVIPSAPSQTLHLLGGWLTLGHWTSHCSCQADIKAMYDHYMHMLATDPRFHDVGGAGMSTLACDEEIARWTARILRHYCIEGRTDSLAEKCGFKPFPGILKDGDFDQGFKYWTAQSADPKSLRGECRPGLCGPRGQNRMNGDVEYGNTFALFTRNEKAPNRLSQRISGLEPGRLYMLMWCTSDYKNVCYGSARAEGSLTVSFDAGEEVPGLTFDFHAPLAAKIERAKKARLPLPPSVITHRKVFRATRADGTVTFSDWRDANGPGWPVKRGVMLNFVSLVPYYIEHESDIDALASMNGSYKR